MKGGLQRRGWKKYKSAILIAAAALIEGSILVGLSFFIKKNMLVSLILLLSFQIPLVVRVYVQKTRVRMICRFCSGLLLTAGVVIFLGCYGRNYYIESMTTVDNNNVDTERYLPFSANSALGRLDEEPELVLTKELPVLNGSAALFPLYSSIVNMIYPEEIAGLNQTGSPYRYTNTEKAYQELLSGKTDLVFSEQPSQKILDSAKKQGKEIELISIGADAFVFFTNRDNPVDALSQDELRAIYSGEVANWSELGGDEEEIVAFQRDKEDGAQKRLETFMEDKKLMEPKQQYQLDDEGITEGAISYTNDRGAIGFSFLYYTRSMDIDKGLKLLAVDGVYPDNENISSGAYPFSDRMYCAVVKGHVSENTGKLLEWLVSPQGQRLVEAAGYAGN